jgi:hypothetical protein
MRPTDIHRDHEIALRVLSEADREELDRLADLDSKPRLGEELVIGAETGGRLIAAISIATGAAVADPFTRSGIAVDLLRIRASQLGAPEPEGPSRLRRAIDALGRGHARAGLAGSPPGAGGRLLEL